MKKGDLFEGVIEKIEFPNKGILSIEGQRITVKNALPGQKIRGVVTKKRNGRAIRRENGDATKAGENSIR